MEETQYIIIAGNVIGGLFFHGPFKDWESAQEYADNSDMGEWEVAPLIAPVEGE